MYRFVRAGILAGCLQTALATIVAVMALVQVGMQQGASSPDVVTTALDADRRAAFALVDVLLAACIAMLRTRAVTRSAGHLASGFRRLSPRNPDRAAAALISQLLLALFGFAALALRPPPDWFQIVAAPFAGSLRGSLAWPALMSIGVAAFGAITHAAILGRPGMTG